MSLLPSQTVEPRRGLPFMRFIRVTKKPRLSSPAFMAGLLAKLSRTLFPETSSSRKGVSWTRQPQLQLRMLVMSALRFGVRSLVSLSVDVVSLVTVSILLPVSLGRLVKLSVLLLLSLLVSREPSSPCEPSTPVVLRLVPPSNLKSKPRTRALPTIRIYAPWKMSMVTSWSSTRTVHFPFVIRMALNLSPTMLSLDR